MRNYKNQQYIVTINPLYVRQLYEQQMDEERKPQSQILREILKDIDDFLKGKTKLILRTVMSDGSFSYTITPLVKHNLQERRKAKRRKR